MIVQLRGGMGAGKSTLARQLLKEHDGQLVDGHKNLWRCSGDLYVLGSYNLTAVSPGGGGDRISGPTGRELVLHYARHVPHLLWESKWGSSEFPPHEWLAAMLPLGLTWGCSTRRSMKLSVAFISAVSNETETSASRST